MRLKQDLDKLREILLSGSKSWGELRQATGWVNSVLKSRIDFLEKLGELTVIMGKRKGRRTPLYTLSDKEKSRAKRAKYASIEFIENLEAPVHRCTQHGKATVSVFMAPVEEQFRASAKETVDKIVPGYTSFLLSQIPRLAPGKKIAVVITVKS